MNNKLNRLLISISIVILLCAISASEVVATKTTNEEEPYTFYWVLGQNPHQTQVYIYAKYGADVTFSGTNPTPITLHVEAGTFSNYTISSLGYQNPEREWYYLEMKSTKPIMVFFDRSITLRTGPNTYEESHGDGLHNKPPMKLSKKYYYDYSRSNPYDDKLILYSHESTIINLRWINYFGTVYTKTITINGLFESPKIQTWLGSPNIGYGLTITADKPIASALFDENMWWPSYSQGSGYFFGLPGQTELYNEYMDIHYFAGAYTTIYTLIANNISFYDVDGNLIANRNFNGESSTNLRGARMYNRDLGYNTTVEAHMVHTKGTAEYAFYSNTPVATNVIDGSAYMGYNASKAKLEIYTNKSAEIKIINGVDNTITNFSIEANTITVKWLDIDFGFAPNQPFLMNIISDVPIYQQVRNPSLLRHYPSILGPGIVSTIRIEPETLNLKSKGEFTAFIKLPERFELDELDISTIVCEGAHAIDGNVADNNHLLVKFYRQDLVGVEPGDEVTFTVEGYFYDGTPFVGWDIIRVIDNRK